MDRITYDVRAVIVSVTANLITVGIIYLIGVLAGIFRAQPALLTASGLSVFVAIVGAVVPPALFLLRKFTTVYRKNYRKQRFPICPTYDDSPIAHAARPPRPAPRIYRQV